MDNEKLLDNVKKKYYVLLLAGVLVIAIATLINTVFSSNNKQEDFTKFNELNNEKNEVKNNDNILTKEDNVNNDNKLPKDNLVKNNDDLIEFDIYNKKDEEGINISNSKDKKDDDSKEKKEVKDKEDPEKKEDEDKKEDETNKDQVDTVAVTGKTVEANKKLNPTKLEFNKNEGLAWPVKGDIIMKYSMDSTIFHETLMVFKCNPGMIIAAKEGSQVLSAAKGKVVDLGVSEELGNTITIDIGSGYNLVYGQLEKIEHKVGDVINKGAVVGFVGKPTKYYSLEGSNVFFQVLKEDNPVNPLTLLKD